MAEQLIQSLSAPFEPEKYHDTYREAVLAMIERKAEGQEIVEQPETEAAPKTVDLMAALEASLAEAQAPQAGDGLRAEGEGRQVVSAHPPSAARVLAAVSAACDAPLGAHAVNRSERDRGRGRGADAPADEPRQGPLPRARASPRARSSTTTRASRRRSCRTCAAGRSR